jgi:hypothetical protein
MILAKFKADCNDEFTVYGFRVFTDNEYAMWADEMAWDIEVKKNTEFYVGTNDFLVYTSLAQLMQDIYLTEIHDAAEVLAHLFYDSRFGWFPEPHEVEEK